MKRDGFFDHIVHSSSDPYLSLGVCGAAGRLAGVRPVRPGRCDDVGEVIHLLAFILKRRTNMFLK